MKRLAVLIAALILFLFFWSYLGDSVPRFLKRVSPTPTTIPTQIKVLPQESVVINTVKEVGPSVVTIVENLPGQSINSSFQFGPFSIFGLPREQSTIPQTQNIGSGFIVSSDGLLITNKHVVSDSGAKYQIITSSDKKYDVKKIYRDPLNDVAVLKIDPADNLGQNLKPVRLGDSSNLQVGQLVIAIGTALGEFRNTVTTGVVSGLGRGITAGDQFQGFAEKLDNVIQTDAAINPGNSGGPLLNSSGEVIGVNVAVSQAGQNIGFALPINVIKNSLDNFNKTGQFNRPYLGVAYRILDKQVALLNNVPAGAVIQTVVDSSPAQAAGIKVGDIIVKIDGKDLTTDNSLSWAIAAKKIGDRIKLTVYRDGKTIEAVAALTSAPNQ